MVQVAEAGDDQPHQTKDGHDRWQRGSGGEQREGRAHQDRVGAGHGREVLPPPVGPDPGERRGRRQGKGDHQRTPWPQDDQCDRPQEVELFLDRQAPRMGHDLHRNAGDHEPVVDVQDRSDDRRQLFDRATGHDPERRRDCQQHRQRRPESLDPSAVEAEQVETTRPSQLRLEDPGDQESGEHEEGRDADVSAIPPGRASVGEHDQDHRDGPKPVEICTIAGWIGWPPPVARSHHAAM